MAETQDAARAQREADRERRAELIGLIRQNLPDGTQAWMHELSDTVTLKLEDLAVLLVALPPSAKERPRQSLSKTLTGVPALRSASS